MTKNYDAIIIGAGHNGLVAAAILAKAGLKVAVFERREILGGAAATEEIIAGFRVNTGASDAGLFMPEIAAQLDLEKHGLRWLEGPALAFAPGPGRRSLTIWRDAERSAAEIAQFSKADAGRYRHYLDQLRRFSGALRSMLTLAPPELPEVRAVELLPWLRAGWGAKQLGRREMMELMRALPMPAADYLDEWFETPLLKAVLASAGLSGSLLGPKAPGTAFMLMYQAMGAGEGFRASRFVQGGTGSLAAALAQSARQNGAEICLGAGVERILLDGEKAEGVALQSGEEFRACSVLSSASPRHVFFDLVGAPNLGVSFVREVKNIRYRGGLARVNLALSRLPAFSSSPVEGPGQASTARLSGHIVVCPDLEYQEHAADEAKYGRLPVRPCLDIVIPTLLDSSLAPPGGHVLCADVQFIPYSLQNGSWEQLREPLGELVITCLEEIFPDIRGLILHRQVLTPLDLERSFGLPEGNIYHGEMALDQMLFMRPVPGYARYRTPVENLFLCGASAHPGGGVTGAPGYNAAREVKQALKMR